MRQYIIHKVKKPLMKAIITLVKRYPNPTRENCSYPNTHILFDIWDKFSEYEDNSGRKALFDAAFKFLIVEYEHDPYYRYRFDWMLEEIVKRGWLPRPTQPMSHWKEPGRAGISEVFPLTPEAWARVVHTEEPYRSMLLRDIICVRGRNEEERIRYATSQEKKGKR